jgi:hypothetical protein
MLSCSRVETLSSGLVWRIKLWRSLSPGVSVWEKEWPARIWKWCMVRKVCHYKDTCRHQNSYTNAIITPQHISLSPRNADQCMQMSFIISSVIEMYLSLRLAHTLLVATSDLQGLRIQSVAGKECNAERQYTSIFLLTRKLRNRVLSCRYSNGAQVQNVTAVGEFL